MAVKKYRLIAGTHVGPDAKGVTRQWSANSQYNVIETAQDLDSLNVRGFPPKFQRLDNEPTDKASLLAKKAEIEAQLANIDRDLSDETPVVPAPLAGAPGGAPLAPPELKDPRSSVSNADAARAAKHQAARAVLEACERMDDDELRSYCEAEEIPFEEDASREDMLASVSRIYMPG